MIGRLYHFTLHSRDVPPRTPLPSLLVLHTLAAMETLSSLDTVLSSLENDPCNVRLITQQCQLLKELSMSAEYIDTLLRLSSLVMLDETTWLSYFDMTTTIIDLDSFVDTLERFEQAERDYLCESRIRDVAHGSPSHPPSTH